MSKYLTKENLKLRHAAAQTVERIALLRAAVGLRIWTQNRAGTLTQYTLVALSADGETCFIEWVHRNKHGCMREGTYQVASRDVYLDSEFRK